MKNILWKSTGKQQKNSNLFELRETAGINQFYVTDEVNENDLLAKYYLKYTNSKVA